MCTSKLKSSSDDESGGDIWADSSDDGHGGDHRELDREAAARHQQFYNVGYRDGLEEGKEITLQQGFNLGFREGAAAGYEWGLLRGAVKTLGALEGQAAGTRGFRDEIRGLQAAVEVPPRAAMLAISRQVLSSQPPQPPPPTQQQHQHQTEQEPPAPPLPSAIQQQSCPEVQDLARPSSAIAAAGASSSPLPLLPPPNPWVSAVSSSDPSLHNVEQLLEAHVLEDRRVVAAAPGVCYPVDGGVGDAAEDGLTSGESMVASTHVDASVGKVAKPVPAAGAASRLLASSSPESKAALPLMIPDATAQNLPDIPRIMDDVRLRLIAMGFDPVSCSAPVPALTPSLV